MLNYRTNDEDYLQDLSRDY